MSTVCAHLAFSTASEAAERITLAMPARCEPGVTCFIQNYVDHDPSSGVRDYQCGGRTYDGHNGTDIRIPQSGAGSDGVEVLAAAAGVVTAIRDGIDDVSVRTIGKAAVAGKECGNGVVLAHAEGWRSQYCHMKKGSVRVKVGDRLATGQPMGLVGLSGETEFLHLHFTVRHLNQIVDPFAYGAPPDSCGGGQSLWSGSIDQQMRYRAREIINFGFSDLPPSMDMIDSGEVLKRSVNLGSDALVAYVRTIGVQKGDNQTLTLRGPAGEVIAEYRAPELPSDKAQYVMSSGRKRRDAAWDRGTYRATYSVRRGEAEVLRKTFEIQIDPKS
jgi:Peptidase family M23